ncbi:hypothetical protein TSAR_010184 [Trichomalopsis sarcophagae]|uniref:RPA-interacting protein C-terminal domain-containing protein n=1 Tax=Trichomalopsis sarcophagae TaxID=543379 RepID=A0A232ETU7_9HYME|nr:hypothetical protein TSAR_010184 [Trichomalopsis sarcophagae]
MATHLSPSNSAKLKAINAVRRIKNGSPKIREVLRERCRKRIHERREELFVKRRHGLSNFSEEVKNTLTDIVHEEFNQMVSMDWTKSPETLKSIVELGFPIDQEEALADEEATFDIDEVIEEQWILEEYQKMLWEQKELLSLFSDDVICPICLKGVLKEVQNFAVCHCGLTIPVPMGLQTLKCNLQEQVNAHSAACLGVPKFSIFQEGNTVSLCFSCMSCDVFGLV